MAVGNQNGAWYIYFRPFRGQKRVGIKLDVRTKREAEEIEGVIRRACRTANYSGLDLVAREACIRMFQNKRWELPPDLGGCATPTHELTLKKAFELFLKDPEIRDSQSRSRHEIAVAHLGAILGPDTPLKFIGVAQLKQYRIDRQKEGAAPGTINREMSTMSKVFRIMNEQELSDRNPVRMIKRLSTKSGEREVYLSLKTVQGIVAKCPEWYQPIVWTAFYTGMRRGEVLGLTRRQVNLAERMIYLGPKDTKEGDKKRVPIHRELVPILRAALKGPALVSGKVFALRDAQGVSELRLETFKNPWERACNALDMPDPLPRFHDLRHTWRTNARRSGVDPQIAEAIMGHWFKEKSVNERYGYISDEEFLQAVDKMTFDHGPTVIIVGGIKAPEKKCKKSTSEAGGTRKKRRRRVA